MTAFVDGPAVGQHLELRRLPRLLRMVKTSTGVWHSLEMLTDVPPNEDEEVYAYALFGDAYYVVPRQPREGIMRDTKAWQEWCVMMSRLPWSEPVPDEFGGGLWLGVDYRRPK